MRKLRTRTKVMMISVGFIIVFFIANRLLTRKHIEPVQVISHEAYEVFDKGSLNNLISHKDALIFKVDTISNLETLDFTKMIRFESQTLTPGMHYFVIVNKMNYQPFQVVTEDSILPFFEIKVNDLTVESGDTLTIIDLDSFKKSLIIEVFDQRGTTIESLDYTVEYPNFIDEVAASSMLIRSSDGIHNIEFDLKLIKKTSHSPGGSSQLPPTVEQLEKYHNLDLLVNRSNPIPKEFIPKLTDVPSKYSVSEGYRGHPQATQALVNMIDTMHDETGLWMVTTSSYRDYEFQGRLYSNYVKQYGQAEADRFSAKPGISEHQTGLAFDMVAPGYSMSDFGLSKQSKWVNISAHRFGFIIRYQEGKESITGYMPEAWHLRYLGTSLAQKVYESGLTYEEWIERNR